MGLWRLTMLVLFVDALGLGAIGYLLSALHPASLERFLGSGRERIGLAVAVVCFALSGPVCWTYHSILALDYQAASGRRRFAGDLCRASWFLVLPLALPLTLLARRTLSGEVIESSLAPLIGWLPEYVASMLALSVATFLLYGEDKFVAQERRTSPDLSRRIRESTLNWLAFLGGWPGALAAQRSFRHKTTDRVFRAFFFLAVLGHVTVIGLVAYLMCRG